MYWPSSMCNVKACSDLTVQQVQATRRHQQRLGIDANAAVRMPTAKKAMPAVRTMPLPGKPISNPFLASATPIPAVQRPVPTWPRSASVPTWSQSASVSTDALSLSSDMVSYMGPIQMVRQQQLGSSTSGSISHAFKEPFEILATPQAQAATQCSRRSDRVASPDSTCLTSTHWSTETCQMSAGPVYDHAAQESTYMPPYPFDMDCVHARQRSECKEYEASGICEHGRWISQCKKCWGHWICDHGQQSSQCEDCRSAPIITERRRGEKSPRLVMAVSDAQGTDVCGAILGPHQSSPWSNTLDIQEDRLTEHDNELKYLFCLGYAKSMRK